MGKEDKRISSEDQRENGRWERKIKGKREVHEGIKNYRVSKTKNKMYDRDMQ
jgi:hypothetical protein